jgi:parvulin-like peptidyl-prolyl isomerase
VILKTLLLVALFATSPGDDVLARVDGTAITRAALARRTEATVKQGMSLKPAEVLDTLVVEVLLAAEGRRAGLATSPLLKDYVATALRQEASRALVDSFSSRAVPDEATLRRLFHSTADFVRYEFLTYVTEADARAALKRIQGGASLQSEASSAVVARLAATNPADPPTSMRGELAPGLAQALFSAVPGQLVGPAQSDTGWVLARVLQKEIGTDEAFAARRPTLLANAQNQATTAARQHVVEQLRAKATVKIDEPFLQSVGAGASPAQLQHAIATVDGEPIRYAEIYDQASQLGARAGHMAGGVRVELARTAVDERLLQRAALAKGYDKAPQVTGLREEIERNGLAALYADKVQSSAPAPTDREIERYHDQNAKRFARPLKQVRPAVAAELTSVKRRAALDARIVELRKKASVSVDENALAGAGKRR